MAQVLDLQEFIVLDHPLQEIQLAPSITTCLWNSNETKLLIDLYKKYRHDVGKMKMKNFKCMWAQIANELSTILGKKLTLQNCENRWKVLDRNYKKWVDNKNSTGRGTKFFEFADEMHTVYGNKKNIHPHLLLETKTNNIPSEEQQIVQENEEQNINKTMNNATLSTPTTSNNNASDKGGIIRRRNLRKKKNVLEQIREDRLKYQEHRLQFLRDSHEKIIGLIEERNAIEKERNEILRIERL